jgi:hypothetical protein
MLCYHADKFVGPPFKIGYFPFLNPEAVTTLEASLGNMGVTYVNGPGITVKMGIAAEDGVSSVFLIQLWQQIHMGAYVQREDAP